MVTKAFDGRLQDLPRDAAVRSADHRCSQLIRRSLREQLRHDNPRTLDLKNHKKI